MKLVLTMLVALAVAGSAVAATNNATLTIKHQMRGCHSWSFDGKTAVAGMTMGHMHASAHVAFPAKGTYVFKTRAGEDYMKGIKTIGEDNVLKLVVTVT